LSPREKWTTPRSVNSKRRDGEPMDIDKMKRLREHYDNTSLAGEIAEAKLNTETAESPMIGITVRFPKPVLDRVREVAARENIKTTALVRRWVEEKLNAAEHVRAQEATTQDIATVRIANGLAFTTPPGTGPQEASSVAAIIAARRAPMARAS